MAKVAQQVLLSHPEKQDVMALAVARQESQAEIVRTLIAAAKPTFLKAHAEQVGQLLEAFDVMNVDPMDALVEMLAVKLRADGTRRTLTIADLRQKDGTWRRRFPKGASAPAE
jgi:hypothetical protein